MIPIKTEADNLYGVVVPIDAANFKMSVTESILIYNVVRRTSDYEVFDLEREIIQICKPYTDKYKIIGTIYYDGEYHFNFNPQQFIKNGKFELSDICTSFISLLQSQGIWFVNKYGEKPELFNSDDEFRKCKYEYPHGFDIDSFKSDLQEWQQAEDKVIKGKLVLLSKV